MPRGLTSVIGCNYALRQIWCLRCIIKTDGASYREDREDSNLLRDTSCYSGYFDRRV